MSASKNVLLLCVCLTATAPLACAAEKKLRAGRRPWRQYKRVHAKAVKQLLGGQHQQVAETMRKYHQDRPDDAETLYCLAIAQAQLKDLDGAMTSVRQAL